MGEKYIIELKNRETLYKAAIKNGEPYVTIALGKPYIEPDLEQIKKEAYEQGRKDGKIEGRAEMWVVARKIAYMYSEERQKIFGENLIQNIHDIYSASEVIEKIRQYEQRQEEQIQVGDEVATDAGNRASVLYEGPDGTQVFVFKSDGTAAWWTKSALHRTGRNFPEIAAVLAKMKE